MFLNLFDSYEIVFVALELPLQVSWLSAENTTLFTESQYGRGGKQPPEITQSTRPAQSCSGPLPVRPLISAWMDTLRSLWAIYSSDRTTSWQKSVVLFLNTVSYIVVCATFAVLLAKTWANQQKHKDNCSIFSRAEVISARATNSSFSSILAGISTLCKRQTQCDLVRSGTGTDSDNFDFKKKNKNPHKKPWAVWAEVSSD